MATGTIVVFEEAKAKMLDGNWASADDFYLGIIDAGVTPIAAFATPTWSDFSGAEITQAGTYVTNGTNLGALSVLVAEAGGTMTFDSATNPSWAADASNPTDATWGIVYNFTDGAQDALLFVDLGGPVDMVAGSLQVTWGGSGLYTII